MAPLEGVRVLDMTRLLPGGYCTLLLADLGADVIKVEDTGAGDYLRWMPPLRDGESVLFRSLNRNKRSVAIDLKQPAGREALLRLVDHADVVVEGNRPGVLQRLELGYEVLRARNPGIILCSITGYGQDGPLRDRAGHDINYAALSGVLSVTGCSPDALAMPGVQSGDLGGALHAAVVILAALHARERSGTGAWCDVSMTDGLTAWMAPFLALQRETETPLAPRGTTLHGRHPCYRLYRCADGHLSLGALEPKFWNSFLDCIECPHLREQQFAEGAEGEKVVAEVEAVLRTRSRREWQEVFGDREVCCEPVLTAAEVLEAPQARARSLDRGDGVASAVRIAGEADVAHRAAPGLGQHTDEVLRDAGFDDTMLRELRAAGVVR